MATRRHENRQETLFLIFDLVNNDYEIEDDETEEKEAR
jgi:hypothetical protein